MCYLPATKTDLFCLSLSVGTGFSFNYGLAESVVGLPKTSANGTYSVSC